MTELEHKFNEAVTKLLENRKTLMRIQKDVDFVNWCKEAREDPSKLLSKISEEVIGKFLNSIGPIFRNLMLGRINVESNILVKKDLPLGIKKNITFSLDPIRAFIEIAVYSEGVKVSSTKFIIEVMGSVKIRNLIVRYQRKDADHKHQQEVKQNDGDGNIDKRIQIENLLFGITIEFPRLRIEFPRLRIGTLEKAIEPPIHLGKREAEIKSLLLFSKDDRRNTLT